MLMTVIIVVGSFIVAGIVVGIIQSFFVRIFGFSFSSKLQFSSIFVFGMLMAAILWNLYQGAGGESNRSAGNAIQQIVGGSATSEEINVEEMLRNHVDDKTPPDPDFSFEPYNWSIYRGYNVVECTGYKGDKTEITIPNTFNGMPVVAVSGGFPNVTKMVIPDSVTDLDGLGAEDSLKSIKLSDNIKNISHGTFEGYSFLESVELPKGLIEIGSGAFALCRSLKSIEIPNGVELINVGAFSSCPLLKNVTIPDSVRFIARDAFAFCWSLSGVNTQNGVILPKNLVYLGDRAFYGCALPGKLTIPDSLITLMKGSQYESPNAKMIEELQTFRDAGIKMQDTFYGCELTEVELGDGMDVVGGFGGNPLTSVSIPKGVVEIGESAFVATHLTSVTIPESMKHIERYAFGDCRSLTKVILPSNNTALDISPNAFSGATFDHMQIQQIEFFSLGVYQPKYDGDRAKLPRKEWDPFADSMYVNDIETFSSWEKARQDQSGEDNYDYEWAGERYGHGIGAMVGTGPISYTIDEAELVTEHAGRLPADGFVYLVAALTIGNESFDVISISTENFLVQHNAPNGGSAQVKPLSKFHDWQLDNVFELYGEDHITGVVVYEIPILAGTNEYTITMNDSSITFDLNTPELNSERRSDSDTYSEEQSTIMIVTAEPTLRMRSGAGAEYDIVTTIPFGEYVEVIGRINSEWVEVRYGDYTGYASAEFLAPA